MPAKKKQSSKGIIGFIKTHPMIDLLALIGIGVLVYLVYTQANNAGAGGSTSNPASQNAGSQGGYYLLSEEFTQPASSTVNNAFHTKNVHVTVQDQDRHRRVVHPSHHDIHRGSNPNVGQHVHHGRHPVTGERHPDIGPHAGHDGHHVTHIFAGNPRHRSLNEHSHHVGVPKQQVHAGKPASWTEPGGTLVQPNPSTHRLPPVQRRTNVSGIKFQRTQPWTSSPGFKITPGGTYTPPSVSQHPLGIRSILPPSGSSSVRASQGAISVSQARPAGFRDYLANTTPQILRNRGPR